MRSDIEARSWYSKSAKLGSSYAKTNLAKMLRDGEGGPINTDVAIQLFIEAAEADDPNAQYELGKIYLEGLLGVRRDRSKAEFWMIKAAEKLHPLAVLELEEVD